MSRPTRAVISVAALRHNLARVRACAPAARVWAVVKANGYGHGLERALAGFAEADGLALIEFEMALRLRQAGWTKPILMLEGAFDADDVALAAAHDLTLAVHAPAQIGWLEAARGARPAGLYLKLNSGMNRLGFAVDEYAPAHRRLVSLPGVRSVGLMTHFANADRADGVGEAMARYGRATQGLAGPRSLANSAALLAHPATHGDWVRPGIALYGGTPFADRSAAALGLRPAMRLVSRLIAVQRLAPGDAVGYGSLFVADRPMAIGVVACGYADGYPRHAPTGTPVAVEGVRTRTLGRVAMDMLMVDLTPVPRAQVGSPVELWGDVVPIDEVATSAGTIGYELMCALAPRVAVDADA